MVDKVVPAEREKMIKHNIKMELIKNKHKAIKNRVTTRNAPFTFVVVIDGTRMMDKEMVDLIVQYNSSHFEQI